MRITVMKSRGEASEAAAEAAAAHIRKVILAKRFVRIALSGWQPQSEFLGNLTRHPVDWSRVSAFPIGEYIGIPMTHPASQYQRVKTCFADKAVGLKKLYHLDGEQADPLAECRRLGDIMSLLPVDLTCVGIGADGSLGFNVPDADFGAQDAFSVVSLTEGFRRPLAGGEGFAGLDAVPQRAIGMTVRQILKSRTLIAVALGDGMADAVALAVEGAVVVQSPASILREHPDCRLYMDESAARRLKNRAGA